MTMESRPIAAAGSTPAHVQDPRASLLVAGIRLIATLRAWSAAGQLGPTREKEIGRHTGART